MTQSIPVATLAALMDASADNGQWNGADVCEWLAELIDQADGWATCPEHGLYSASAPACPWCG